MNLHGNETNKTTLRSPMLIDKSHTPTRRLIQKISPKRVIPEKNSELESSGVVLSIKDQIMAQRKEIYQSMRTVTPPKTTLKYPRTSPKRTIQHHHRSRTPVTSVKHNIQSNYSPILSSSMFKNTNLDPNRSKKHLFPRSQTPVKRINRPPTLKLPIG